MKAKKLLAGIISAATVLSFMAMPASAEDEITFAEFLTKVGTGESVSFDGETVAGAGKNLKVVLEPKTVCTYGDCTGAEQPSDANPKRLDSGMAQYQIWESKKDVNVKNVDFVYKKAEFRIHTNSQWSTSAAVTPDNGQIQILNSGNIEITDCSFDGVDLNFYRKNSKGLSAKIDGCTFKNTADGAGIKWLDVETATVINNTFENCKAGVMITPKGNDCTPVATVTGNTFDAIKNECIQLAGDADYTKATITVDSNTVTNPTETTGILRFENANAKVTTFTNNTVGDVPVSAPNGKYAITAKIGNAYYASFSDALAAAAAGDTIYVIGTVKPTTDVKIQKNITISGGTFDVSDYNNGGEGFFSIGYWEPNGTGAPVELTLNNVNVIGSQPNGFSTFRVQSTSKLTINGGKIDVSNVDPSVFANNAEGGTVILNGVDIDVTNGARICSNVTNLYVNEGTDIYATLNNNAFRNTGITVTDANIKIDGCEYGVKNTMNGYNVVVIGNSKIDITVTPGISDGGTTGMAYYMTDGAYIDTSKATSDDPLCSGKGTSRIDGDSAKAAAEKAGFDITDGNATVDVVTVGGSDIGEDGVTFGYTITYGAGKTLEKDVTFDATGMETAGNITFGIFFYNIPSGVSVSAPTVK